MEAINLNLIPNGTNPVVHCSQYDEGREFRFNLFDGASVFILDGTEDITCDIKKPDGNIVTAAVPNTEDDYIIVTTTLQMCACSGNSLGTINISKGGVNLYTLNFVLYCERSPLENGIQSDSAIHNLESQVEDIVSEQYDSANVIFDNVPTSGHGTPYTVNSDGLYNYIPKNVSDMDDVTITTPVQGEALVFDNDGNLVNGTVSTVGNLDDLSDVDTTGKATGDSLRYDGAEWIAQPTTVALTQAEYDALQLSGDLVPNTHYVITDAPNLNPTASDIEYSSGVTVKQAIDSKVSTSDLPIWIKQAVGTSVSFAVPCTFFYYYADQWRAYVQFPFIAKNNNYSISLTSVQAENIGDITSKISVIAKYGACFEIETTKTMTALPNQFSVCVGTVNFTITFA